MIIRPTEFLRDQYRLVLDSYTGQGGFATGEYIFEFAREINIAERQKMADYTNFINPIVDARVDPAFIADAVRTYEDNEVVSGFLDNADNNGTSLQQIIHHATTETTLVANSFIVVDSFPEKEIPEAHAEMIEGRKYPYVYTKSVLDVYEYETDIFGKLLDISFYYGIYETLNDGTAIYQYKRFTPGEIEIYKIVKDDDGNDKRECISSTKHSLGIVPVAYYDKDVLPFPPYYSMATLARKIYNTDSQITSLQRDQMFSILLMPSMSPHQEAKDNIILSTDNAIFYDAQAQNKPEYIAPDAAQMTVGLEQRKASLETLIQSADVLGTTAISTGNSANSGIAESYRFFGKQQALLMSAKIARDLEKQVIHILALYLGDGIEYEVEYPSNFSPTFTETKNKIDALSAIADMDISDQATATAHAEIIRLMSSTLEWSDELTESVLDSITEVQEIL